MAVLHLHLWWYHSILRGEWGGFSESIIGKSCYLLSRARWPDNWERGYLAAGWDLGWAEDSHWHKLSPVGLPPLASKHPLSRVNQICDEICPSDLFPSPPWHPGFPPGCLRNCFVKEIFHRTARAHSRLLWTRLSFFTWIPFLPVGDVFLISLLLILDERSPHAKLHNIYFISHDVF